MYLANIEKTDSNLLMLESKLEDITRGAFIQGLTARTWNEQKIKERTSDIKNGISVVDREKEYVLYFVKDYFDQYAINNKSYLPFTEAICNRIKSTLKNIKGEFYNSCPRLKNKKLGIYRKGPMQSVYEASLLCVPLLVDDLFPFEEQGYKQCVKDLIDAYMEFNYKAIALLRFCQTSIQREKQIQKNPDLVRVIYEECFEKEKQRIIKSRYYTNIVNSNAEFEPDPITLHINQSINRNVGITTGYHSFDSTSFWDHTMYRIMEESRADSYASIKKLLWGSRTEDEIYKYTFLVEHLDSIYEAIDNGKKKKKIPANILAMVLNYCKPFDGGDDKTFVNNFMTPIHNSQKRKYELTRYSAIKAACISKNEQDQFDHIVDKMISTHIKYKQIN